jgi:tryptophan-rich sensory protein
MSKKGELGRALIAILPVLGASLLGQLATYPNLAGWYSELAKPLFNPPGWVFAPVWTTLYILMAWAVWRILKIDRVGSVRKIALILFFVQLTMNALWSWLFFGLHSPLAGLVDIVPQLVVIVTVAVLFLRLDRIAGICLIPLALWVGFATLLNFEIWRLNA